MSEGLVVIVLWQGEVRRYRIDDGAALIIGRDASCDIHIEDGKLSRRHARIALADALTIEDLGSRNGTILVGGEDAERGVSTNLERALTRGVAVDIGDESIIRVGTALIRFERASGAVDVDLESVGAVIADEGMLDLYTLAARVAASEITVLIEGESGVGKEVIARFVHERSGRAKQALVTLNCGAIPRDLLESELFGHEPGAFTGATARREGLLETASGGTLFLDEIGELDLALQVKFLRVLDAQEFMRVGGRAPITLDVRFLAATNRRLLDEVEAGTFREDLFYRLAGITLSVPPLRERRADILPIARRLLGGRPIADAAAKALVANDWPGNVRQLKNVLTRAVVLAGHDIIGLEHLAFSSRAAPNAGANLSVSSDLPLKQRLGEYERQQIVGALEACAGNQTRAAELLGMTRREFTTRLKKYKIPRPRD